MAMVVKIDCSTNNTACDAHEGNVLDLIGGVSSVQECRRLCLDQEECYFLPYFNSESFPYKEMCLLMKYCDEIHVCSSVYLRQEIVTKHVVLLLLVSLTTISLIPISMFNLS